VDKLATFLDNHELLSQSLYSTTHRMPTNNVTADHDELLEALRQSEAILVESPLLPEDNSDNEVIYQIPKYQVTHH
jgi:hypothetical protein